jgi:hypothetical protein
MDAPDPGRGLLGRRPLAEGDRAEVAASLPTGSRRQPLC